MDLTLYYIIIFLVSLCTTWCVFKKVLNIAKLKNIVDNPDARKLQRVPVPVLGGIAVFFGILTALMAADIFFDISNMFSLLCVMAIMVYLGTIDDITGLSVKIRLFLEILFILILIFCNGYSINNFHGLWGIYEITPWIAVPLTVFACVGIINAINMIDGINGLSSGYCITASALFGFAFIGTGDLSMGTLAIVCIGSLIPFFFHNVFGHKSKMFIGDCGTLLMGTVMSIFVINALKTGSTISVFTKDNFGMVPFTLAVLAVPVFDTLRVMTLRIIRGTSPFNPDKTHLHHLLLDLHFSHIGASVVEIFTNLLVVVGWYISYRAGASVDLQLYIVILLGVLITFAFYKFARVQEKKQSKAYFCLTRIGEKTHCGNTKWFNCIRNLSDRNCQ